MKNLLAALVVLAAMAQAQTDTPTLPEPSPDAPAPEIVLSPDDLAQMSSWVLLNDTDKTTGASQIFAFRDSTQDTDWEQASMSLGCFNDAKPADGGFMAFSFDKNEWLEGDAVASVVWDSQEDSSEYNVTLKLVSGKLTAYFDEDGYPEIYERLQTSNMLSIVLQQKEQEDRLFKFSLNGKEMLASLSCFIVPVRQ